MRAGVPGSDLDVSCVGLWSAARACPRATPERAKILSRNFHSSRAAPRGRTPNPQHALAVPWPLSYATPGGPSSAPELSAAAAAATVAAAAPAPAPCVDGLLSLYATMAIVGALVTT